MAQYRFKLLRGPYVDSEGVTHLPNTPSAFINSDVDLGAKYGREKFLLVSGGNTDSREFTPPSSPPNLDARPGTEEVQEVVEPRNLDELEGMTVNQLQSFAAQEEVDLTGATTKQKILERIKAHYADPSRA